MSSKLYPIFGPLSLAFVFAVTLRAHPTLADPKPLGSSETTQSAPAKPQSPELAESTELISRVVKLYAKGQFEEALPLAKRALQLREKASGADDQLVRNAQVNLAEVYIALRKYREAESPLERAVKSYRAANPNDVRLAQLLERKAIVQYSLGNNISTQSAYEESLQIKEKVFGVESAKTAVSLLQLGEFHQFAGYDDKAATYYKRLVAVREKASGPDRNEQLGEALGRYVCLLRKLKRGEEADLLQAQLAGLRGSAPVSVSGSVGSTSNKDGFLGGGVLNGKAITLAKPEYPDEARSARISGTVVVQVWIDEAGNVRRACAVSGASELRRAAELAAYQSRFSPTTLSGMPVKVTGVITYKFVAR